MHVVGETIQQRAGEAFRAEHFRPFVEEQFCAGGGQGHIAQVVDDQQAEAGQILLQVEQRYLIRITDHVFLPNENHFSNLPNLTCLSISINRQGPKFKSQYRLFQELFQNNVKLEQVKIEIWEPDGTVRVERNTFLHLDQLQSLSLAIDGDTEISLSPNSPLLKDIIHGNQSPSGYTIIPPGAK